jgi:hypothetical protein
VRLTVEPWAQGYGSPVEEGGFEPLEPPVLDVELPEREWEPITPDAERSPVVWFVDGVQRVEASITAVTDEGGLRRGRCVSFAAGVIRCNTRAEIVAAEVRHELLAPDKAGHDIETPHGTFAHVGVNVDDARHFVDALHERMADLEAEVSRSVHLGDGDLLITDGPLSGRRHGVKDAVGYVKTHPVTYLPVELADRVVGRLATGQRSPVFRLGPGRPAWYVRLPCVVEHPWSGIVRCEAEDHVTGVELFALADRVAATLPRFASEGHRDPRAPQNLYPIGSLEKHLRHLLGESKLWYRALRRAVAA